MQQSIAEIDSSNQYAIDIFGWYFYIWYKPCTVSNTVGLAYACSTAQQVARLRFTFFRWSRKLLFSLYHLVKQTWILKINQLYMMFLLKLWFFQCYVSFPFSMSFFGSTNLKRTERSALRPPWSVATVWMWRARNVVLRSAPDKVRIRLKKRLLVFFALVFIISYHCFITVLSLLNDVFPCCLWCLIVLELFLWLYVADFHL